MQASEHAAEAAPAGNALVEPMGSAGQYEERAQGRKLPAGFAGPGGPLRRSCAPDPDAMHRRDAALRSLRKGLRRAPSVLDQKKPRPQEP